jgi:acetylornithine aminotransferase
MTGYRSGFVAGDGLLIDALKAFRPSCGTAPQEFVQRASVVAWSDETHVERARASYRAKRDVMVSALARSGMRSAGGSASMYLWVAVPAGQRSEEVPNRLLERGILVAPGSYLGAAGEGYLRFALVPTLAECERAAALLEEAL